MMSTVAEVDETSVTHITMTRCKNPGLGRIRNFSEDRKSGQWLPEDQWAVRQPGSTCPDLCGKPKKPPKPSKSWLSICRDPDAPKDPECDVRHNNCPPPPVKSDAPWYSLDNLISKKKPPEKLSSVQICREEMKRRELADEEEVCECIQDKTFPLHLPCDTPDCCCIPKEPCPAPVVTLSCPVPKELDIMLWCGKPCTDTSRIAIKCQSDRLPYQEFRPRKTWKPPPFSLPIRGDPVRPTPCCPPSNVAYSEFKQVDVPKPLYTRYKSVELGDCSLLLCMTDVKCPDNGDFRLGVSPTTPPPSPCLPCQVSKTPTEADDVTKCPEKRVIEAASCKPVKIKKAPKYCFRPKLTKLVERRKQKNAFGDVKCDLPFRPQKETEESGPCSEEENKSSERPKVLTATLTNEPSTFERQCPFSHKPPRWMYALCKPGAKNSPLLPDCSEYPEEPDRCSETDGLKFYDDDNENISPKPPPDPCLAQETRNAPGDQPVAPQEVPAENPPAASEFRDRFVLMPDSYNIKRTRCDDTSLIDSNSSNVEQFIQKKAIETKNVSKSYPPMKENILYDLQRLCPNPPFDPSKLNAPCRKPPDPECPQPYRFHRSFSTFTSSNLKKLPSIQLHKLPCRTECGDSSGKCKARKLTPKPKDCPEPPPKPECAEMTLPCCPKARTPPDCNVKKPMPICKRKLPPKPSFSECSKDPPPCPKMTECDCWEKKMGGKGRKYSDWAAKRVVFDKKQLNDIPEQIKPEIPEGKSESLNSS